MNSNNPTHGIKILMEFIGTFILSGAINLSTTYVGDVQIANPLLIFLSFFAAVTILRNISGGHVNPAVSIGVFMEKSYDQRAKEQPLLTLYILAQTLGAICACLFSYIFYKENVYKLTLAPGTLPLHAFVIEVIGTALFVYTILCQGKI
jgi:aquaporin Z